jgi:hypothetical protein
MGKLEYTTTWLFENVVSQGSVIYYKMGGLSRGGSIYPFFVKDIHTGIEHADNEMLSRKLLACSQRGKKYWYTVYGKNRYTM